MQKPQLLLFLWFSLNLLGNQNNKGKIAENPLKDNWLQLDLRGSETGHFFTWMALNIPHLCTDEKSGRIASEIAVGWLKLTGV